MQHFTAGDAGATSSVGRHEKDTPPPSLASLSFEPPSDDDGVKIKAPPCSACNRRSDSAGLTRHRVCVLGGGSFGSAIARIVASSVAAKPAEFASEVRQWVRREALAIEINTAHTNAQYLPGATFGANLVATTDAAAAVADATLIILAVPHEFLEATLRPAVAAALRPDAIVLSLVKSLHVEPSASLSLASSQIASLLGLADDRLCVLMGPNIYKEMLDDDSFAEATIGYDDDGSGHGREGAALAARALAVPCFATRSIAGRAAVESCGALKNIIALGVGMCDGAGHGANCQTALIRAGLGEMERFATRFLGVGATHAHVFKDEACGVGDLVLTCTAGRGRQLAKGFVRGGAHEAGDADASTKRWAATERELFSGMKLPDWHTVKAARDVLLKSGEAANFPIFSAIGSVAFDGARAGSVVDALRAVITSCNKVPPSPLPPPASSAPTVTHAPGAPIDFGGRRALVTGGASGIGKATALRLAACGARVVVLDRDPDALAKLKAEHHNGLEEPLRADLLDDASVAEALEIDRERSNGQLISLLVNNAGVAQFRPEDESPEVLARDFDLMYGINVKALILLTQRVTRALVDAGETGAVVHISSQSSTLALSEHLIYSSGKAAVDHAARIHALELAKHGIRVNTVRPTVVLTALAREHWKPDALAKMAASVPLGRLAEPDEVASSVAWLLSDQAAMVTGATLPIDGGRSMGGFGL